MAYRVLRIRNGGVWDVVGDPRLASAIAAAIAAHLLEADPHPQYAPLASPALTGNPTTPTAGAGDADTTIANTLFVATAVAAAVPAGVVQAYGGTVAPSGWLMCDGSAVSRTTYAGLFGAISTIYGAGDGSTTFNVPDLRGRAVVGAGAGTGLTSRTLGTTFGAETHTLSTGEMPAHSHTVSAGTTAGAGANPTDSLNTGGNAYATSSQGGGAAHNNVQPSLALNYIVKT